MIGKIFGRMVRFVETNPVESKKVSLKDLVKVRK
jgi:hypothetical protein